MSNNIFEQIKKVNEYGQEYWSARDLSKILGYTEYGKFLPAIERAKESCKNSGQNIDDHFAGVSDMVKIDRKAGAFGAFIFNKETKNKKDKSW
jgi:DNA-damage-inducible protein D